MLLIWVASHSRNNGLLKILFVEKLSNLSSCFVAVLEWHITVHEYYLIVTVCAIVALDIVSHHVDTFLTIHGSVANLIWINLCKASKHYLKGMDIEYLIIYYKNPLRAFLNLFKVFPYDHTTIKISMLLRYTILNKRVEFLDTSRYHLIEWVCL